MHFEEFGSRLKEWFVRCQHGLMEDIVVELSWNEKKRKEDMIR